jgi:hypothetical protein
MKVLELCDRVFELSRETKSLRLVHQGKDEEIELLDYDGPLVKRASERASQRSLVARQSRRASRRKSVALAVSSCAEI